MPFHDDSSDCRQVAGVSAGRGKSFPACWMPCPSPLPVTVTWSSHWVSPLSCCGRGLCQSSTEPCGELQAHQVHSSLLAAPLPGSCVAAAAFGAGLGGCALGWDSSRLLGLCLLPLALLQVCAGLSRTGLYWASLASLPPVPTSCPWAVQSHRCGLAQASLGPVWHCWYTDLLPVPSSTAVPSVRCHPSTIGLVC